MRDEDNGGRLTAWEENRFMFEYYNGEDGEDDELVDTEVTQQFELQETDGCVIWESEHVKSVATISTAFDAVPRPDFATAMTPDFTVGNRLLIEVALYNLGVPQAIIDGKAA